MSAGATGAAAGFATASTDAYAIAYTPTGFFGHVLQVFPPQREGSAAAAAQQGPARLVLVLDQSGSMGGCVNTIVSRQLPEQLRAIGMREDFLVHIITFESSIGYHRIPLSGLAAANLHAMGSTLMAGVFPKLNSVLASFGNEENIWILVVSDGELNDKPATLLAAETAISQNTNRSRISVGMVRLQTSASGVPDTRALASICCYHSAAHAPQILEANYYLSGVPSIAQALSSLLRTFAATSVPTLELRTLSAGMNALSRAPGESGCSVLRLDTRQPSFVFVAEGFDPKTLVFNNQRLCIRETTSVLGVELLPLLKYLETKVRSIKAAEITSAQLIPIQTFLQACLASPGVEVAGENSLADTSMRARQRVAMFKRGLHVLDVTLVQSLLQLSKSAAVTALSQAQRAEYLRQDITGTSKAGKAAAARVAARCTLDLSVLDSACQSAITELNTPETTDFLAKCVAASNDARTSYLTYESLLDSLLAAAELVQEADQVTAGDFLKIVGATGVGVQIAGRDKNVLPNPWDVCVKRVFTGFDLSEADIHGHTLYCPGQGFGPDAVINAVVPLMSGVDGDRVFDFYMQKLKTVATMQASVSMRAVIAPVPYDILALCSATLLQLVVQIGSRAVPSEGAVAVVQCLLRQVSRIMTTYGFGSVEVLAKGLAARDVRGWLTGEPAISVNGRTKPLAVLLSLPSIESTRLDRLATASSATAAAETETETGSCNPTESIAAIYGLDVHFAARREYPNPSTDPEPRMAALLDFYGVNLAAYETRHPVGAPGTPDPPFVAPVTEADTTGICERAAAMTWLPSVSEYAAYLRFVNATREESANFLAAPFVEDVAVFGHTSAEDHAVAVAAAVSQGLRFSSEKERVNIETREGYGARLTDAAACRRELIETATQMYRDAWDRRLRDKRTREAAAEYALRVERLYAADYGEGFIPMLRQFVPTNGAPMFKSLMDRLLAKNETLQLPLFLRVQKLWTMVTGRHWDAVEALPYAEHDDTWSNGNLFTADPRLKAVLSTWKVEASGRNVWECVFAIPSSLWRYRDTDENTKGHSNAKPSYRALGYNTMDQFMAACGGASSERYLAYKALHEPDGCCGFRDMSKSKVARPIVRRRRGLILH